MTERGKAGAWSVEGEADKSIARAGLRIVDILSRWEKKVTYLEVAAGMARRPDASVEADLLFAYRAQ
jgi:hypothetical protein